MAVAGVEGKPLRLKDLLELDCDSCSAAGFRCYPRHLCVTVPLPVRHERAEAHSVVLGRSHSLRHPMVSIRSLSRRLRGSFSWRSRHEEAAAPVPAASSSSSSDSETSSSSTERKSESDFSSASSAESLHAGVTTATDGHEHKAMERGSKESGSGSEADGQEQLSPVSVMDFPFEEEEDDGDLEEHGRDAGNGACSPSFRDSLAQLHQRRNIQLQHKIRRHGNIIRELCAVDLDERFAASEPLNVLAAVPAQQSQYCLADDEAAAPSSPRSHRNVCRDGPDEDDLLALLRGAVTAVDVSERLLLDFFAETRKPSSPQSCEAALRAAEGWIEGTGPRWGLKEVLCGREDLVAEMDRSREIGVAVAGLVIDEQEEKREIGVAVAGLVIDELVHDLIEDLLL